MNRQNIHSTKYYSSEFYNGYFETKLINIPFNQRPMQLRKAHQNCTWVNTFNSIVVLCVLESKSPKISGLYSPQWIQEVPRQPEAHPAL